MVQNNFKESFIKLVETNSINGRITLNPFDDDNQLQASMNFDEIYCTDGIAMFYDDVEGIKGEMAACFRLNLSQIKEVHFCEDALKLEGLYGSYDALIEMGENFDEQIIFTFNMNNKKKSPFIIDLDDSEKEPLYYAYAEDAIKELDYFLDNPVKIQLSAPSYQSRYDAEECSYGNPIVCTLEIESFDYEFKSIDNLPCVTIKDKTNDQVKVVLNAIGSAHEVNGYNREPDAKRIYHVCSEVFLASIMDKGYKFPCEEEGDK